MCLCCALWIDKAVFGGYLLDLGVSLLEYLCLSLYAKSMQGAGRDGRAAAAVHGVAFLYILYDLNMIVAVDSGDWIVQTSSVYVYVSAYVMQSVVCATFSVPHTHSLRCSLSLALSDVCSCVGVLRQVSLHFLYSLPVYMR